MVWDEGTAEKGERERERKQEREVRSAMDVQTPLGPKEERPANSPGLLVPDV